MTCLKKMMMVLLMIVDDGDADDGDGDDGTDVGDNDHYFQGTLS